MGQLDALGRLPPLHEQHLAKRCFQACLNMQIPLWDFGCEFKRTECFILSQEWQTGYLYDLHSGSLAEPDGHFCWIMRYKNLWSLRVSNLLLKRHLKYISGCQINTDQLTGAGRGRGRRRVRGCSGRGGGEGGGAGGGG